MSLEKDISSIRKLMEQGELFRAADTEQLANREEVTRLAKEKEKAEMMKQLGPLFQKLIADVQTGRALLKDYEKTLEQHRYHYSHNDSRLEYHAGNYPDRVSYRIKVSAWPSQKFVDEMESYGISNEIINDYVWEQYNWSLSDFVGSERREVKDKTTGHWKTEYMATGGGLMADYPDLIDEWYQTGSQGGYLALVLTDLGFEDFESIEYAIEHNEYTQPRGYQSFNGINTIKEDLAFVKKFNRALVKRMIQLGSIENKVRKGVKSLEKYIESTDFENDFRENNADRIADAKAEMAEEVGEDETISR